MTRSRWSAAAVVAVLVAGTVVFMLFDGGSGTGPSAGDVKAPPPKAPSATAATASVTAAPPPGDGPPNHADNNRWKRRHELTAGEQAAGAELAELIRPKLEALRTAGDLTPASTRQALLGVGIGADAMIVRGFESSLQTTPPPGAVFAVTFPERGCVIGAVRPDRVQIEVTGSAAEFGCLEPNSH